MKKILLLSGVLALGNACATERESVSEDLFSGFYVGAGVSFSRATNKSDVDWTNFRQSAIKIQDRKVNKTSGSIAVGYGQCFAGDYYVGAELSADISGNKSYRGEYYFQGTSNYRGKIGGVVPSAVVRFGYCFGSRMMAYVKGGVAYLKSDFTDGTGKIIYDFARSRGANCRCYGSDVNISKVVPVIGGGIEQKVGDSFGLRLEGDYRLNSKKTSVETALANGNSMKIGLRNRVSGFTARVMGTYKF